MILCILSALAIACIISLIIEEEFGGIFPVILLGYVLWILIVFVIGTISYDMQEPITSSTIKTTTEYTIDMKVSDEELKKAQEIVKFGGKYVFQLNKEHYEAATTTNIIIWPLSVDARDKEVWKVVPERAKK